MQSHLLNQFISVVALKKQVNLYVVNTFFALSIGSYYVGMYHIPKNFRWTNYIEKFYALQQNTLSDNISITQESVFPVNHYTFSHYYPTLRTEDIKSLRVSLGHQAVLVLKMEESSFPLSFLLSSPSSNNLLGEPESPRIPDVLGKTKYKTQPESDLQNVSFPSTSFPCHNTFHSQNIVSHGSVPALPLLLRPFVPVSDPILSSMNPLHNLPLRPEDPINSILGKWTNSKFQESLNNSLVNSNPDSEILRMRAARVSRHPMEVSASLPVMKTIQTLENIALGHESISSPLVTPILRNSFPTYNECLLRLKTHNPSSLLQSWLQTLTAGPKTKLAETFIDILLSKEFYPYVNASWEAVEGEDDAEDVIERRRNFHYAYVQKVLGVEDLHLAKEDGYLEAYEFPLKLGIRVYRDCDICVEN